MQSERNYAKTQTVQRLRKHYMCIQAIKKYTEITIEHEFNGKNWRKL